MAEYHDYLDVVKDKLILISSRIHISFDGWTTPNGKKALTGICVHHLDEIGQIADYLLAAPRLMGKHSGENYAQLVITTLQDFGITKDQIGWFVTDNAFNNDTALEEL